MNNNKNICEHTFVLMNTVTNLVNRFLQYVNYLFSSLYKLFHTGDIYNYSTYSSKLSNSNAYMFGK